MSLQATCERCGRPIPVKQRYQNLRWCSFTCRYEDMLQRMRQSPTTVACSHCAQPVPLHAVHYAPLGIRFRRMAPLCARCWRAWLDGDVQPAGWPRLAPVVSA